MSEQATDDERAGTSHQRLIAIRPGALGDALLTFSVLAWLRGRVPGLRVTLVARRDVLPLARDFGVADDFSPYDDPAWSALFADEPPTRRWLAAEICDGARVVAWTGADDGVVRRNALALGASAVAVAPGKPDPSSQRHMALQLCDALRRLGYPAPGSVEDLLEAKPPFRPSGGANASACDWLRENDLLGAGPVAVHPGSGGDAKRWPAASFAALLERLCELRYRPFLVEGPADAEAIRQVRHACRLPSDTLPVARGLSIETLACVLAQCEGYVGNDSGVTHLAGLVDCRAIAIFGPSSPAIWRPLGRRVVVNRAATGRMEDVSVDSVIATLETPLSNE